MKSEMRNEAYPSLVQGVSQQSKLIRRTSQCEAQENCLNSVVNGVEARSGGRFVALRASLSLSGSCFYRIRRGAAEQYLVAVQNGDLRVYNLLTGSECSVSFPSGKTYLNLPGGSVTEDSFSLVTLEDTTIVANKTTTVAMAATLSPSRPKEGIVAVKAGNYDTRYTVAVSYNGTTYKWIYKTPSNVTRSTSGPNDTTTLNQDLITTDMIAATLFRAMTGVAANDVSVNTDGGLIGSVEAGQTSNVTGPTTKLPSVGFSVAIDGNVIRVWRPNDNNSFRLSVSDGAGQTHLVGFTDFCENYNDLPRSCFSSYVVRVAGEDQATDDDYFVSYTGNTGQEGVWKETVAPATQTSLNASTMPHQLRNTAVNTFVFEPVSWGTRICGDGINTAKNPSFVGKRIREVFFDRSRLGILSEGSLVWSRARQPFVFFPDTAQTTLDTDPVDTPVRYKEIVLLRRFVAMASTAMAWGEGLQFWITTNDNTFKQDTLEAVPMSAIEFSDKAPPLPLGQLLFSALDHGAFTSIRDLVIERGRIRLDNTTTAHVPRYLPSGFRFMAGSDTLGMLLVHCSSTPRSLYVYQYVFTDEGRIQSAWSRWTLPVGSEVLWAGFTASTLHLVIQRVDGVVFETHDLSYLGKDSPIPLRFRADHGVTQAQVTGLSYNATTNRTTFTLPLSVGGSPAADMVCILEADSGLEKRGTIYPVVSVSGTTIVVEGDLAGKQFLFGWRITSSRQFSEFIPRNPQNGNTISAASVGIDRLEVAHGPSGYYRVVVSLASLGGASGYNGEYHGRRINEPGQLAAGFPSAEGSHTFPISADSKDATITLVNDSPYPSSWIAAEWYYHMQRSQ